MQRVLLYVEGNQLSQTADRIPLYDEISAILSAPTPIAALAPLSAEEVACLFGIEPSVQDTPETVAAWRYPDEGNTLWGPWIDVDPSVTTPPEGIKLGDTVQWLLAHERTYQEYRPFDYTVKGDSYSERLWTTQSADDLGSIIAYRVKVKPA